MKVNERRTVVGVDWPLDWPSISVHGWGDTRVSPPTVERDRRAWVLPSPVGLGLGRELCPSLEKIFEFWLREWRILVYFSCRSCCTLTVSCGRSDTVVTLKFNKYDADTL